MKELDFSNIKIIHKFKRANLIEAENMLLNATNLSNINLISEINDLTKLNLLIKKGLSISTIKETTFHKKNNNKHLLDNISKEKLLFLINNQLDLLSFKPLDYLYQYENFQIFISFLHNNNYDPIIYFSENSKAIGNFTIKSLQNKEFKTIETLIPFINILDFWYYSIYKLINDINIEGLYFLYQQQILTEEYILKNNIFNISKNGIIAQISRFKKEISDYYDKYDSLKKYGYSLYSSKNTTLKDKKQEAIYLSFNKKELSCLEDKLITINNIWKNQEQFFIYFVEKEKVELKQIFHSNVLNNKKRL